MNKLACALPTGCDLVFVLPHLGPGGAQKVALLAAEHFLADGLNVALVTLLPGHAQAHDLPEGLCWVDLGGDVASARSHRTLKTRSARLLHRWLALLLAAVSWPVLQGLRPGRHGGVVRWLLIGLIGPQASLLHRLLAQAPPRRVMSMLTRTNLLCCQALWMLPGHLVVSERNDPSRQRLSFPWPRLQGWLWCRADRITANTAGVLDALQCRNPGLASRMNLLPNPLVLRSAQQGGIGFINPRDRRSLLFVDLCPRRGLICCWRPMPPSQQPFTLNGDYSSSERVRNVPRLSNARGICSWLNGFTFWVFKPIPAVISLMRGCSCCHHGSKGCQTLYWKRWDADLLRSSLMHRQARWKW